ncbi:uncharacterized protein PHACADRAFT_261778 [Phanerochaete carnosa HHB-10118-sp]|uniref:Uncharacterized protein n=1 Tax=Phanerochaete carnosa (strain HHB-10118-sp) TaxID=650164 RepID=K5UP72_PHACS|nr:uncharacterized protein PHACADRAFT_261778 [Phanerochaete carnosa HHB-10118-sp]EKM51566.1 hypothetical protein PHACADRAFT_261778 [Phanerochaete carnosa HHB-10118-sp]
MSDTPTSQYSDIILPFVGDKDSARARRISAPVSPAKTQSSRLGRSGDRTRSPSPSPDPFSSRTPRKRASVAITASDKNELRQADAGGNDVISAALAAAGSVSKRGVGRNPLPKEFADQSGRGQVSGYSGQSAPCTPPRHRSLSRHRRSPSPSPRASTSQLPTPLIGTNGNFSPSRRHGTAQRTSTARDFTRRHQTRWMSEDLSASAHFMDDAPSTPSRSSTSLAHHGNSPGRRPTNRRGSDGPPTPGRSLVGEGLRTAGITWKRDPRPGEDPFAHSPAIQPVSPRRTRSTGGNSVVNDVEWESPLQAVPNTRVSDRSGRKSAAEQDDQRPVTSMAALYHDSPANATRAPSSTTRLYQSTRALQRERSTSSAYDDPGGDSTTVTRGIDGRYPSPSSVASSRPSTAASGVTRDVHAEHRRLMLEALTMFESHLPPMGQTTTSTIPEVFQSSQQVVHSLDLLNNSLRAATNEALKFRIAAEVADSDSALSEIAEIWHRVGDDHREHLKISDELVRTTTQFLLGIGRIIRDVAGASQSQHHLRGASMDEDVGRRLTPDVTSASTDQRSSDGRISRETRRSWDPREVTQSTLQRLANMDRTSNSGSSRLPSSLNQPTRGSVTSSSDRRSPSESAMAQTPPISRPLPSVHSSTGPRRLYVPRDRSASDANAAPLMSSLDSQETVHGYEPSPTPVGRLSSQPERTRALPPLAIPPSLSTLPSESLLSRSVSFTNRRKASSNSQVTVRAEPSLPSVIKQATATTAVTPTTVSNIDATDAVSSISRSNSISSIDSQGDVASRPTATSALGGIKRSLRDDLSSLRSPMSGSETERPRTFSPRSRASLEGSRPDSIGRSSQASTLTLTRKERRRTITDIFSQVKQ